MRKFVPRINEYNSKILCPRCRSIIGFKVNDDEQIIVSKYKKCPVCNRMLNWKIIAKRTEGSVIISPYLFNMLGEEYVHWRFDVCF